MRLDWIVLHFVYLQVGKIGAMELVKCPLAQTLHVVPNVWIAAVRGCHRAPRRIGTTATSADAGASQYFAHAAINWARFANRSPRR